MWLPSEPEITAVSLVSLVLILLYYYSIYYDFWELRGIPYIRPKYPFLGNSHEILLSNRTAHEWQQEYYKHFNDKQFGGLFHMRQPKLFLKDPSLIESVLVKEFTSFHNQGITVNNKKNPISTNLVNLEGKQWKCLRTKLNPIFATDKVKEMLQQLVDCSELLVNYVGDYVERGEPVEIRKTMAKFSTDVIASCAFGLTTNALNDDNSEFRNIGMRISEASTERGRITFSLANIYSRLILYLTKLKNVNTDAKKCFSPILKSIISCREKNNVVGNDFVQSLMELKKHDHDRQQSGQQIDNDELIINDDIIIANAMVFFVAGFETIASTLSYCLYELSLHPEIQEQAYQHIFTILKKHDGKLTYDSIKEMTLINQILAETLRIYPPVVEINRKVNKDYVIPGTKIVLPVGGRVCVPIYSLHHDSKYFPEPDKFKPERFAKKKENIKKGTYLPFGCGPRVCIGKRFAKMEMQVALVKLLLKYKFTLNQKTITPLKYNPSSVLLVPLGCIWLDIDKRV